MKHGRGGSGWYSIPMKFSVIIPARDEEANLPGCLDSIEAAAQPFPAEVEVVVVANRCLDHTEEVALSRGAVVVRDESKNLSMIRNTGARRATGDIIVTIDADSRMSPGSLSAVDAAVATNRYVGGGAFIQTERFSLGIIITGFLLMMPIVLTGISAGMFWCRKKDFDAIGGFNEKVIVGEDLDFAFRLKAYGKKTGRKFGTIWRHGITTSCRKFDRFGDWFMLGLLVKHPLLVWKALRSTDRTIADKVFYDFKRNADPADKRK